MSGVAECELLLALGDLESALSAERIDAALAVLPRVLSLCAELRAGELAGAEVSRLRQLADGALRRAQQLQEKVGERLQAAGTSRIAIARYPNAKRAA